MGPEGYTSNYSRRVLDSTFTKTILIIIVAVWVVLGFTKIIIGSVYKSCSGDDLIPAWLIVDALIPIIFITGFALHLRDGTSEYMKRIGSFSIALAMVLSLVWCILGGVWIYPTWSNAKNQCDRVVKNFAFAMLTVNWCPLEQNSSRKSTTGASVF